MTAELPAAAARIRENLTEVRAAMAAAARQAGRDPAEVRLLAVTKYAGDAAVRALHAAGVRDFGESTVQRGAARREGMADLEGARWHLIGHLQRNKVARALETFASIHSLDSLRLAREIAAQAKARSLSAPDLYLEVNLAGEAEKTGLPLAEAKDFLAAARDEGLFGSKSAIAGLMGMAPAPRAGAGEAEAREGARLHFRRLRELRDALVRDGLLPTTAGLSMGMSGDFAEAIAEGATVVRVGSRLFAGVTPGE